MAQGPQQWRVDEGADRSTGIPMLGSPMRAGLILLTCWLGCLPIQAQTVSGGTSERLERCFLDHRSDGTRRPPTKKIPAAVGIASVTFTLEGAAEHFTASSSSASEQAGTILTFKQLGQRCQLAAGKHTFHFYVATSKIDELQFLGSISVQGMQFADVVLKRDETYDIRLKLEWDKSNIRSLAGRRWTGLESVGRLWGTLVRVSDGQEISNAQMPLLIRSM